MLQLYKYFVKLMYLVYKNYVFLTPVQCLSALQLKNHKNLYVEQKRDKKTSTAITIY